MTRFVSFAFEVVSICHKMLRLSIRIIGAAYKDCFSYLGGSAEKSGKFLFEDFEFRKAKQF